MDNYPFWMVWCADNMPPMVKHQNEQDAKKEAERLAGLHPGHNFYVLEAKMRVSAIKPVECVKLEYPF